jgi:hypothetical protein
MCNDAAFANDAIEQLMHTCVAASAFRSPACCLLLPVAGGRVSS